MHDEKIIANPSPRGNVDFDVDSVVINVTLSTGEEVDIFISDLPDREPSIKITTTAAKLPVDIDLRSQRCSVDGAMFIDGYCPLCEEKE